MTDVSVMDIIDLLYLFVKPLNPIWVRPHFGVGKSILGEKGGISGFQVNEWRNKARSIKDIVGILGIR
jgi:hypothetical protein